MECDLNKKKLWILGEIMCYNNNGSETAKTKIQIKIWNRIVNLWTHVDFLCLSQIAVRNGCSCWNELYTLDHISCWLLHLSPLIQIANICFTGVSNIVTVSQDLWPYHISTTNSTTSSRRKEKNGTKKKMKSIGMCCAANKSIECPIGTTFCMLYHFISKCFLCIQFNISIDLVEYGVCFEKPHCSKTPM